MKATRLTIILYGLVFLTNQANGQMLSSHQWENRVLIISTPIASLDLAEKQIHWLNQDTTGLKERKLLVYQTKPDHYKRALKNGSWQRSNELHALYHQLHQNYTVTLIGLDGGVKLTQNQPITLEKLFGRIDSMPMRQSEIRRQKRKISPGKNGI